MTAPAQIIHRASNRSSKGAITSPVKPLTTKNKDTADDADVTVNAPVFASA
jgi:hypothetical protein